MRAICYFGKGRERLREVAISHGRLLPLRFSEFAAMFSVDKQFFSVGEKFMRQLRMRDGRRTAERGETKEGATARTSGVEFSVGGSAHRDLGTSLGKH